jgi:hypothetical protein
VKIAFVSPLSRLLDESAFPVLALAVATSQIQIGHHKNDAVRGRGRVAIELPPNDPFPRNAEKESSQPEERAASHKESTYNT